MNYLYVPVAVAAVGDHVFLYMPTVHNISTFNNTSFVVISCYTWVPYPYVWVVEGEVSH
jgi:hypothetical protein